MPPQFVVSRRRCVTRVRVAAASADDATHTFTRSRRQPLRCRTRPFSRHSPSSTEPSRAAVAARNALNLSADGHSRAALSLSLSLSVPLSRCPQLLEAARRPSSTLPRRVVVPLLLSSPPEEAALPALQEAAAASFANIVVFTLSLLTHSRTRSVQSVHLRAPSSTLQGRALSLEAVESRCPSRNLAALDEGRKEGRMEGRKKEGVFLFLSLSLSLLCLRLARSPSFTPFSHVLAGERGDGRAGGFYSSCFLSSSLRLLPTEAVAECSKFEATRPPRTACEAPTPNVSNSSAKLRLSFVFLCV